MTKISPSTNSLQDLRLKVAKLSLEIAAGREKNTSATKSIKKQIAQLLTRSKN